MQFQFNKNYFILFLLFFITEVSIALFIHDDIIRPFFGDYLVVFLIFFFVNSFIKWNKYKIAFYVLVFAFGIEFLQYINLVSILGLQKSKLVCTIIGNSFSVIDLGIYLIAFLSIIAFENAFKKFKS
jgi:hypothetical protein